MQFLEDADNMHAYKLVNTILPVDFSHNHTYLQQKYRTANWELYRVENDKTSLECGTSRLVEIIISQWCLFNQKYIENIIIKHMYTHTHILTLSQSDITTNL